MDGDQGSAKGLRLTERVIPIPKSISPQAQAALAMPRPPHPPSLPALDDKAGWRKHVDDANTMWAKVLGPIALALDVPTETRAIAGVPVYVSTPKKIPPKNQDKILLYIHGGGLVIMGGDCTRYYGMMQASEARATVYAIDYGNPPESPFPGALNDCVAVYRELIKTHSPKKIVISGKSGGGNIAAAMVLKIRDDGLPLPAAVGLWTPEVDLTEEGDTFRTLADIDPALPGEGMGALNALYADGADLRDPYVSPLFADFTKGYPPTFIQTGTRDLFLSNSVRIHRAMRKAGIEAELHVGEAMPHGGFGGAPEDKEIIDDFAKFLAKHGDWAPP